jgi:hypothetical protein
MNVTFKYCAGPYRKWAGISQARSRGLARVAVAAKIPVVFESPFQ